MALALMTARADRDAVFDDYGQHRTDGGHRGPADGERHLRQTIRDRPVSANNTHPETMQIFLDQVDEEYGGVAGPIDRNGWTAEDNARLRAKLRD